MSGVALVQFSSVDTRKLLPLARQTLDRNLADAADAAGKEPPLHHMLCIAAIKNPSAKTSEEVRPYVNLFHAGFVVVADERYMSDILELAGMPCVMVDTIERGFQQVFLAGNLSQWRDAVMRGCQPEVPREAREVYNKIYIEFKTMGLGGIFRVKTKENPRDTTFLLEHKP
ncbi:MAG: hypothetical protein ACYSWO_22535 [Planctomycetota bacterium]